MTALLDQVAVVTGAASPIGMAVSGGLAAAGARLVLGDVDGDALGTGAAQFNDPVAIAGDLSTEEGAATLVGAAMARFGRIDILVNNAGGGVIRPFLSHTPRSLKTTVDRNLWTCLWMCRAVLPHMVAARYGRIINIGADSVRNGLAAHAAYNAAKGGMHGLTTGLAREFALHDITVNTVAPAMIRTPQVEQAIAAGNSLIDEFLAAIPKGRPGEAAEVAGMVTYLAGPGAGFVTGQVISVNGGSTML